MITWYESTPNSVTSVLYTGPFTHTLRWAIRCAALRCAELVETFFLFLLARLVLAQHSAAQDSAAQRSVCVNGPYKTCLKPGLRLDTEMHRWSFIYRKRSTTRFMYVCMYVCRFRTETNMNVQLLSWIRNWRMLLHMRRSDATCPLTRWHHFSAWNDVMAAILNVLRHIKNRTQSIDAYLLEEQLCWISPRSDLKRRNFIGFFLNRVAC